MRRAIMVVLDGLRRDFVTEAITPRLVSFMRQAEYFPKFRSAFPSATRIVSATFATGCFPARHTLQGNAVALMENGVLVPHDVGRPDFLAHKRTVTGHSLAVPTLAERLAPHGGAIVFNNVSPGAARAHDPDGFGHVYHRAISVGPGLKPEDDPLRVTLDAAGDRAMTDRFITEIIHRRRPAFGLLWCGEPDHIQHNVPLGSPEHLTVLREADRHAGMVMDAVARERERGDDILLIVASDHGHETVSGVIDVEADLIEAGLKHGPDSTDVVAMANGTATLIYLHPDAEPRRAALDAHLRAVSWAGSVFAEDKLGLVGHAAHQGLAFAVSMRADEGLNDFGVPGQSLAAKPRWDKPDRLGCGQHGGLGAWEQSPVLMIDGPGFMAGAERASEARIVDLAPTILAHLGVIAPDLDGRALLMRNERAS
ncbi:MAG: nucleotide pyrophosphatase [Acetobacteraceae bacterium]|nr:nucleotide pyrophosphatase [Acetobacteraceae bacterium]